MKCKPPYCYVYYKTVDELLLRLLLALRGMVHYLWNLWREIYTSKRWQRTLLTQKTNKSSLQKVEEETRMEDRKVMTNPRECPSLERKKN